MKVVESGYKIDLHIHSKYSYRKDKKKVAFNTIDNIPVLVEKLSNNDVQICAITDHDIFDYDMYSTLKKYEMSKSSSIIKVFPGVEFSVEFEGENGASVIHIIAIFEDEKIEQVKLISSFLVNKNGDPDYDRSQAFSERKFLEILRCINLDTILIAHQKSSLSSTKAYKNDVKVLGNDKFYEFIYTDYFEAFEFKNRKNEIFNKNFLNMNKMTENIRFITGSDCHDWSCYPRETENDQTPFGYSYVKCIPNFRGLVMAITDYRRIKTVNSFFGSSQVYTKEINMSIANETYKIPLSRGINVIIGDNSVGKSLLLHKITNYQKFNNGQIKKSLVNGYERYLKANKIDILTKIPSEEIFAFDMQGEIREKFEQAKIKSDDFFKSYYPTAIKSDAYKEKVQRKLTKIYDYLEEKFEIDRIEAQLPGFQVLDKDIEQIESLTFIGSMTKNNKKVTGYKNISSDLDTIVEKIETLKESEWLEISDQKQLEVFIQQLKNMSCGYIQKKEKVEYENEKIALFQAVIKTFREVYQSSVTDSHKEISTYNENINKSAERIVSLILKKDNLLVPDFYIEKELIEPLVSRVFDYEFISRLNITEINEEYIKNLFCSLMNKSINKSVLEMSQTELAAALFRYTGSPGSVLDVLKISIEKQLEEDFENKFTITLSGTDCTQELSAGFNSKIYFDILSYENNHEGVYIIDQPEDNISQKSIREYLLDRFKIMGENRQVIIVTHNPQFIVNLDVDNVIYLGKENGKFIVQSGALEYKDEHYNILDIISNHIEGGLDTLRKRWKRYEKSSSISSY